jgi:phosphoglycolate phosphatase-like HAD superfamily hydrolase
MKSGAGSLVLFDIDGTLLRGAGRHHKNALLEGIRRVTGLAATFDGIDTAGMLDRDLIEQLLRGCGASKRAIRVALKEIIRQCQLNYIENCAADLSPFLCANVRETLSHLRSHGAALGLVTGNLSDIAWKKMELAGIRHFFSIGAFAEDGRTRTRLAQLATWQARREGLIGKNGRITLVGDHANDIIAARTNGFQAVAVATGVTPLAELAVHQPDILVSNLGELDIVRLL